MVHCRKKKTTAQIEPFCICWFIQNPRFKEALNIRILLFVHTAGWDQYSSNLSNLLVVSSALKGDITCNAKSCILRLVRSLYHATDKMKLDLYRVMTISFTFSKIFLLRSCRLITAGFACTLFQSERLHTSEDPANILPRTVLASPSLL